MQMIELTGWDGMKLTMNPQHIVSAYYDKSHGATQINFLDKGCVHVQESYEELKEILRNVSTEETTALLHVAARLARVTSGEGKEIRM